MAIPKEYTELIERGLRSNKEATRFYYRCKIAGKEFVKTIDYTTKDWTKADRKKKARQEAEAFRAQKETSLLNPFNPDTKMDDIAKEYFEKKCVESTWTSTRKKHYEHYIQPIIGHKKVSRVIENDVNKIRLKMESGGLTKQNANGNSYRSIQKVLMQVLKPMMRYAQSNGAIDRLPNIELPKAMKRPAKKSVKDGTAKLSILYKAIQARYQDDPFYRALFLFALQGRRWNEIRTLEWQNIDFDSSFYTILASKNKIGEDQDYTLPDFLKDPLLQIYDDHTGFVFKSARTGGMLSNPKKQLLKLKEDTGIEELTMHYFRHVLVTAMGEAGAAATVLSASLGHIRGDTVDAHYRSINHRKASGVTNKQIEQIIDAEVEQ